MPTGYTCDIEKGISFKEYALGCARAFGACIEMRDEPQSTPIPDKFEADNYHLEQIKKSEKELANFEKMTIPECNKALQKEIKENLKYNNAQIKKNIELKEKYEKVLEAVNNYIPPSQDHVRFKEFMKEQIDSSMGYDCNIEFYEAEIKKNP